MKNCKESQMTLDSEHCCADSEQLVPGRSFGGTSCPRLVLPAMWKRSWSSSCERQILRPLLPTHAECSHARRFCTSTWFHSPRTREIDLFDSRTCEVDRVYVRTKLRTTSHVLVRSCIAKYVMFGKWCCHCWWRKIPLEAFPTVRITNMNAEVTVNQLPTALVNGLHAGMAGRRNLAGQERVAVDNNGALMVTNGLVSQSQNYVQDMESFIRIVDGS